MSEPIDPTENVDLCTLLSGQATLLSGNPAVRTRLVDQTLRAAAYGADLNPNLSIADALFEIMRDIAKTDLRTSAYGDRSPLS